MLLRGYEFCGCLYYERSRKIDWTYICKVNKIAGHILESDRSDTVARAILVKMILKNHQNTKKNDSKIVTDKAASV